MRECEIKEWKQLDQKYMTKESDGDDVAIVDHRWN